MPRKNIFFLFVFLLIGFSAGAQLKKSSLGNYSGEIPAYELNTGHQVLPVEKTPINILLSEKAIQIEIGNQSFSGTYSILFKTKSYTVLEAVMDNQQATERIIVYRKGKKISREGIKPQPDALLFKKKKR